MVLLALVGRCNGTGHVIEGLRVSGAAQWVRHRGDFTCLGELGKAPVERVTVINKRAQGSTLRKRTDQLGHRWRSLLDHSRHPKRHR